MKKLTMKALVALINNDVNQFIVAWQASKEKIEYKNKRLFFSIIKQSTPDFLNELWQQPIFKKDILSLLNYNQTIKIDTLRFASQTENFELVIQMIDDAKNKNESIWVTKSRPFFDSFCFTQEALKGFYQVLFQYKPKYKELNTVLRGLHDEQLLFFKSVFVDYLCQINNLANVLDLRNDRTMMYDYIDILKNLVNILAFDDWIKIIKASSVFCHNKNLTQGSLIVDYDVLVGIALTQSENKDTFIEHYYDLLFQFKKNVVQGSIGVVSMLDLLSEKIQKSSDIALKTFGLLLKLLSGEKDNNYYFVSSAIKTYKKQYKLTDVKLLKQLTENEAWLLPYIFDDYFKTRLPINYLKKCPEWHKPYVLNYLV